MAPVSAAVMAAPTIAAAVQPIRHAYAALDLGTNNCRLLIARPTADSFRVIDAFSRIVRLGEGLGHSSRLLDAAQDRAIEALKVCRDKLQQRQVTRTRLIATEACRAAENGADFLSRVASEAGLHLEVIDREMEATLAAKGCVPLMDPSVDGVLLFDIGGGSTELVWLERPRRARDDAGPPQAEMRAWVSLPVGVVTLSERHGGIDVTPESFEAMVQAVTRDVERFHAREALTRAMPRLHLLGTSGTVTTLAGIHLGLARYERRLVDGLWLDTADINRALGQMLAMTYADRVGNACIGPERADLVLAGCAIFEAIRRVFPTRRMRVADRGLREGMLIDLMRADRVWSRGGRPA
jgi:exopolyphosphatase/guanosine-5'-triphosphate,3'-diphosphate pyrophosphatase